MRYGRLVIESEALRNGEKRMFICRCDCAKVKITSLNNLQMGKVRSCGCLARERASIASRKLVDGRLSCDHPLYWTWANIKGRTENPNNPSYNYYGGRGIKMCERWAESFADFVVDMGPKPDSRMTLERIDNDGDYDPLNCRWATIREQANNKRSNRMLTFRGETKNLTQWARATGISFGTLRYRIESGWPVEKTLTLRPASKS